MCVENPDGYLPKHPVSEGFETELGLEMVKISYCFFGNKHCPQPQKNTVLWTNSKKLIAAFGSGDYSCQGDCGTCINGKHMVGVQDMKDRCAAYPPRMCSLVASLIAAEVRAIKRARSASSNRGRSSKTSSRSGSIASSTE
mmetsp:Transcript_21551/g.44399  ORF Transcript_21551/g.44399 Transcript_21551/m.44399 type:complete len:141 (-) Transcript_21551:608-1030(-)